MRFPPSVIRACLQRANGWCENPECRGEGKTYLEVDHKKERWEGGRGTLDNAQALCKACHRVKTDEATRRRAKADRQSWAAPGPGKPPRKGRPLPGTKRSGWKHRLDGGWERR